MMERHMCILAVDAHLWICASEQVYNHEMNV